MKRIVIAALLIVLALGLAPAPSDAQVIFGRGSNQASVEFFLAMQLPDGRVSGHQIAFVAAVLDSLGLLLDFFEGQQLDCLHPNVDHPAKLTDHAIFRMRTLYPTALQQALASAAIEIMTVAVLGGCQVVPHH